MEQILYKWFYRVNTSVHILSKFSNKTNSSCSKSAKNKVDAKQTFLDIIVPICIERTAHTKEVNRHTNLNGSIQLSAESQTWRCAEAAGAVEDPQAQYRHLEEEQETVSVEAKPASD